jgi:CheY-like chemotaxis protein
VGQWRQDIVICGIAMPAMDSYGMCRRLRQAPGMERVPAAAVSGYGGLGGQRKSQEVGFDRHLVKPIGRAWPQEPIKSLPGE